MKLGHGAAFAVIAASLAACAAPPRRVAQAPTAPAVGVASLMTAELAGASDAPRVGKSHRTSLVEDLAKDDGERRTSRKPGGGFSGYK